MKLHLLALACATGLLLSAKASAAPAPDSKTSGGPTVALQVKSIDELLGSLKTTAKTFFPEAMYKSFEQHVLNELDPNKLKSVAANKPFGLYATIGEGLVKGDFSKTSIIALIPVTDEKAFIELLGKANVLAAKKGDDYEIQTPDATPFKVSMRFLKDYAYIIVAPDKVDSKALLSPKELFDETEKAAVALRIRPDRLPNDLKKKAAEILTEIADIFKDDAQHQQRGISGMGVLFLMLVAPVAQIAMDDDVKEVVHRFDLNAKTGSFVNEVTVETNKGTDLAKWIRGLQPTKNDFAGIIGADSLAHASFQAPLFAAGFKSFLDRFIDGAAKRMEKNAANDGNMPKEGREAVAEAFKTLRRTINDGNLDLATSMRGPDANDRYTAVGAFSLKDTSAFEKSLKDTLMVLPKEAKDLFKADAFKVNGVNVHEILVGDQLSAEAQNIFGKSSVYVALAPNAVFITFGSSGKALMQEMLTQKLVPKPTPLLDASLSGKRLMPFLKKTKAPTDGPEAQFFEMLSKIDRLSLASVNVQGGDKLVVRTEIGLVALSWFAMRSGSVEADAVKPAAPAPIKR